MLTIEQIKQRKADNLPVWINTIKGMVDLIGLYVWFINAEDGHMVALTHDDATALLSAEPMIAITQAEYERLKARIDELETTLEEAMVKDFNLHG